MKNKVTFKVTDFGTINVTINFKSILRIHDCKIEESDEEVYEGRNPEERGSR